MATCLGFILAGKSAAESPDPLPTADDATRAVGLLEGRDTGLLEVQARAEVEDRIRVTIRNVTRQRLAVAWPPTLAAIPTMGGGQARILGDPGNAPGAFGAFGEPRTVAVPPRLAIDLTVPALTLAFRPPAPNPTSDWRLAGVQEVSPNLLALKALSTISRVGTSRGVAQAVVWKAFDRADFEAIARQGWTPLNLDEVALARGFLARLDVTPEPVGDALIRDRLTFALDGPDAAEAEGRRLAESLDGHRLLGFLARERRPDATPDVPKLHLDIALRHGGRSGGVTVRYAPPGGPWRRLAPIGDRSEVAAPDPDGPDSAEALDRALASAFVSVRPARHVPGLTWLRVENRLPWTLDRLVVEANGAPVQFGPLGIGPGRQGSAPIQAPRALVGRVVLNGL